MSVNGLDSDKFKREGKNVQINAPLELQSDRIHHVHVQRHQQANRALVPAQTRQKSAFFFPLRHATCTRAK